ncbi:hypothetical protein PIB30_042837 [Stylosanthes scabra]|uniref:EF-hand domain-containing protein n=1 Tax=Stylosanthes scabra TaxID=79078 RepID=A0ABU6WDN8_9FABA|nr:hypothetical protein [Stylosanthes scabra]
MACFATLRTYKVIAMMLREVDTNSRGCISVEKLVSRVSSVVDIPMKEEDELREAFKVFDSKNNGRISIPSSPFHELAEVVLLPRSSPEQFRHRKSSTRQPV